MKSFANSKLVNHGFYTLLVHPHKISNLDVASILQFWCYR